MLLSTEHQALNTFFFSSNPLLPCPHLPQVLHVIPDCEHCRRLQKSLGGRDRGGCVCGNQSCLLSCSSSLSPSRKATSVSPFSGRTHPSHCSTSSPSNLPVHPHTSSSLPDILAAHTSSNYRKTRPMSSKMVKVVGGVFQWSCSSVSGKVSGRNGRCDNLSASHH